MIDVHIFESPLSLILSAVFVVCILLWHGRKWTKALSSPKVCTILIVAASVATSVEGSLGIGLAHHWAFAGLVLLMLVSLGFTVLSNWKRKSHAALLSHLGFFFVLFGGFFGAPDVTDCQLKLQMDGTAQHVGIDGNGNLVPLPFDLSLTDFKVDYYEDGKSPKQYTSVLSIVDETLQTSVNHPCRYKGYRIYQSGLGDDGLVYSVLKVVRDPWLPVSALGALLLAISAFMSLKTTWNSWRILIAALVLAIVFTAISVARISFGTLMPALRSLWFFPHLIVYMLAYSIMAISVVTGVAACFIKKIPANLSGRLLSTASSLMLIGMLCGAVWAKQAWGDYWTWDPKECWAAVTWLLSLAGTHVPKKKMTLLFTILAFLAMQMTWYGVNHLPSSERSLHTYNIESKI